jgi:hypothetical protein
MSYENVENFPVQASVTPLAPGPQAQGQIQLHDAANSPSPIPTPTSGLPESPNPAVETAKPK